MGRAPLPARHDGDRDVLGPGARRIHARRCHERGRHASHGGGHGGWLRAAGAQGQAGELLLRVVRRAGPALAVADRADAAPGAGHDHAELGVRADHANARELLLQQRELHPQARGGHVHVDGPVVRHVGGGDSHAHLRRDLGGHAAVHPQERAARDRSRAASGGGPEMVELPLRRLHCVLECGGLDLARRLGRRRPAVRPAASVHHGHAQHLPGPDQLVRGERWPR
mmetsp:Transcript_45809/g.118496  ORF Transcript_45809/g.118496 Transcript_45809/m.118496 type:complete len:226 (+) Transcript_45809:689-1366(+)